MWPLPLSRGRQVLGGRPRIDGHWIAVHDIAATFRTGYAPDEIEDDHGLTRGQVYAALACYFDHQAMIDRQRADGDAGIRHLAAEDTSRGAKRIRRALKRRRQAQGS